MIKQQCPVCGNFFKAYQSQKRKTCSIRCSQLHLWSNPAHRKKMSQAHKGHVPWIAGRKHSKASIQKMRDSKPKKADRFLHKNGYVYWYCPDHPRAINGRIPEQTLVAEAVLGRYLRKGEVVHHINNSKTNNQQSNLLICTETYHKFLHARMSGFRLKVKNPAKRDTQTGRFVRNIDGLKIEEVASTVLRA